MHASQYHYVLRCTAMTARDTCNCNTTAPSNTHAAARSPVNTMRTHAQSTHVYLVTKYPVQTKGQLSSHCLRHWAAQHRGPMLYTSFYQIHVNNTCPQASAFGRRAFVDHHSVCHRWLAVHCCV